MGQIGRLALQASKSGIGVIIAEKRHFSREALVQHQPEAVQIGPPIEGFATHNFWRQILGSAHHDVVVGEVATFGSIHGFGDAKISQQKMPVGTHEDVAGFDVAVDVAVFVGGIECRCNCGAHHDRQTWGEFLFLVE